MSELLLMLVNTGSPVHCILAITVHLYTVFWPFNLVVVAL